MKKWLFFTITIVLLSCGGTEQNQIDNKDLEVSKKEYEDSIRRDERLKLKNKDEMNELTGILEGKINRIKSFKIELKVQEEKLEYLKTPKFLRTPQERETQIRNQMYQVEDLKNQLSSEEVELESLINRINKLRRKLGLKVLNNSEISNLTNENSPSTFDIDTNVVIIQN
jgi:hypothetical protein